MCSYWLKNNAPKNINEIQLVFPVSGHSFIPPDRVFALIEKKVKNRQTIISPSEYFSIFEEHGNVQKLGSFDCPVKDWKCETTKFFKPPGQWHFQFSKCKRFIVNKTKKGLILIRGECCYKSDIGVAKSVLKPKMRISDFSPALIEKGTKVKKKKKN